MRTDVPPLLCLTHALLRPETAAAAAEALRGTHELAAVEALVELLADPPSARAAVAAIQALEGCDPRLVAGALLRALRSPHVTVRLAASEALSRCGTVGAMSSPLRLLQGDGSWLVRRAALNALAVLPEPDRWHLLVASDDPHWRVRHALLRVLMEWGENIALRPVILARLAERGDDARPQGVRDYLQWRWTGRSADLSPLVVAEVPIHRAAFWDWDAAVLLRKLQRLEDPALEAMPDLLGHADVRVRGLAADRLRAAGEVPHLLRVVALLDEPRAPGAEAAVKLLASLELDRIEATARCALQLADPSPAALAWATGQLGMASPDGTTLTPCVESERVSQPFDSDPFQRAAALTSERAVELVAHPKQETSWHVLARAARLAKVPFWNLEPASSWHPTPTPPAAPSPPVVPTAPPYPRLLGPEKLLVAPLGVSGHYGLPVEGFARAVEAGVNLLFWEPNYQTLTDFLIALPPRDRHALHIVTGTFEADARSVRRDAERALRTLKIERLALFLVFWVQSWERIIPEVREALDALKKAGRIANYGLSTHSRPFAVEALEAGWDPVMVRHSAAHRGAEDKVFPKAREYGTSLLTFNNTCYGRLLKPQPDVPAPTAADCYRYTLSYPAVTACWTAPGTVARLEENLEALHNPLLPDERRCQLLKQGDVVYGEDVTFRCLVRSR